MRRFPVAIPVLLLAGLLFPVSACRAESPGGPTVVVPIKGMVNKAQFIFLRRALKEAERDGAAAVILDMDTPGGELGAAVDMVGALQKTKLRTVTFVDKNAGSAGALIALGTREIYMAPVSAIGAAAPVMSGGEDLGATMQEKVVSYYSKYFRGAAEVSGHNPDLAEAFINAKKEVKIGDRVISEKDSLLTLSPREAVEIFDGKPLLAAGIVDSVDALVAMAGLGLPVERIEPTGLEVVAFWITTLSPLLLTAGMIGAYLEFKTPGFGLPGIVAGICFLLFFTGHYIAGLAGYEVFVLFAVGFLLVLVELLFFPGVVVMALCGMAMMLGALLWAMVDRYPSDPVLPDFTMLYRPLVNLGISFVGGAIVIAVLAQFLPKTALFNRIVLGRTIAAGPSLAPESATSEFSDSIAAGMTGRALTPLRPTGKAQVGDHYLDVVSDGDFIDKGEEIVVSGVERFRVLVRRAG